MIPRVGKNVVILEGDLKGAIGIEITWGSRD